ncbi:MAG TPA: isocitrate lyase/phosphoenolpyruvate mutase family protein [Thermoplasmata archaeon]|nr:isocitrate lyase/phosphoenolpyruvate mutase family protein [Thermoplasmata archaeon]
MTDLAEKAEAFRRLHLGSRPFVLPNAWDVPSARIFEDAGFPAVATSSAGVMVSRGYPDGERMPRRELLDVVGRIARALRVPLSADLVSGYGRGPRAVARTVRQAVTSGAIGINLEDLTPTHDGLLRVPAQVRKIRAIRELAGEIGVPIVINARTDALRHAPGEPAAQLREAIRRASAYRDAGADCVYPMGLTDAASIETFVGAVGGPVNVMVRRGLPSLAELERLGVKRVSFGPSASYAALGLLKRVSADVLERASFDSLLEGAISFDELNRLALPRSAPASPPS